LWILFIGSTRSRGVECSLGYVGILILTI